MVAHTREPISLCLFSLVLRSFFHPSRLVSAFYYCPEDHDPQSRPRKVRVFYVHHNTEVGVMVIHTP
ncbi:unnamed protein product [Laminaria digitata]